MNEDQASLISPRSGPPPRLNNKNLKRKEKNEVCEVLTKISKRLDSSTAKKRPTFSAFGEVENDEQRRCQVLSENYQ